MTLLDGRMTLRRIAILGVAVVAAATGLTSRSNAAPTSVLRVGLAYPISTLDASRTIESYQTLGLALEQLVRVAPNGKVIPWLAKSITQPSPAVYVYHLRHGVKFSDGNELTATDVANALNYYRYPASQQDVYLLGVRDITARDRYTVVVTLKHRDAAWEGKLAVVAGIFEKSFQDAHKATLGKPGTLIIGTGPWKFDSLDPTTGAELSANPYYWGGKVKIQRITLTFFADETSEAIAFRGGAIDLAFPNNAQAFASTSGAKIVSVPGPQTIVFTLDTIAAPWNDVHVRRAVAYALNRANIIKAYGSPASPLTGTDIIPPAELETLGSHAAVNKLLGSLPSYSYSLQKAKQELSRSAYPHGFSADFNTLNGFGFNTMAEVIAAQLKQIGINLTVNPLSVPQWLGLVLGAQRDKIGIQFLLASSGIADPSDVPSGILGSKNASAGHANYANWGPPDVDNLLAQSVATLAPAKRLTIYGRILSRLATDVPYIGIATAEDNLAISSKFRWPLFNPYLRNNQWALNVTPA